MLCILSNNLGNPFPFFLNSFYIYRSCLPMPTKFLQFIPVKILSASQVTVSLLDISHIRFTEALHPTIAFQLFCIWNTQLVLKLGPLCNQHHSRDMLQLLFHMIYPQNKCPLNIRTRDNPGPFPWQGCWVYCKPRLILLTSFL